MVERQRTLPDYPYLSDQQVHMANPTSRGSSSDDDSWGKIASDLFGIQFNDGDDFELPDDDAPKKPQPVTPVSSESVASELLKERLSAVESEEDLAEEVEPVKASVAGNEDHDEFWDILESWNWDESTKQSPPSRRTEEPRTSRPRSDSGPAEARRSRRDEPPRREEKRAESTERPRRREAEPSRETVTSAEENVRASRPPREESRRERPARAEQPARPRRPEGERPAAERKPERAAERPRTREASASFVGDEFGAGVDEVEETPRTRQAPAPRRREEPAAPRRPVPAKRAEPVDEFEGDLFVEDLDEEGSEEEESVGAESNAESDEGESERPRRRRRRRRRRGRSATEPAAARTSEFDDSVEAEESEVLDEAEEESAGTEVGEDDSDEDREPPRPRRRRRRRGRRPEAAPAAEVDRDDVEAAQHDEEGDDEDDELINEDDTDEVDEADEEVVVPVSYEGIPTWEEAISYLVITPPTESRGHHRGRRDDSRRR